MVVSNVQHGQGYVRENEISGNGPVMGEMKVHKMKNRKESKSAAVRGDSPAGDVRMGKERREPMCKGRMRGIGLASSY